MRARLFVITAAIAVLAALGAGAPAAQAAVECRKVAGWPTGQERTYCVAAPRDYPAYKGWAGVVRHHCGYYPFNAGQACTMDYQSRSVWASTASGWKAASLGEGTHVYVHPFTTGWRWVYHSGQGGTAPGWYAIREADLNLVWDY